MKFWIKEGAKNKKKAKIHEEVKIGKTENKWMNEMRYKGF